MRQQRKKDLEKGKKTHKIDQLHESLLFLLFGKGEGVDLENSHTPGITSQIPEKRVVRYK